MLKTPRFSALSVFSVVKKNFVCFVFFVVQIICSFLFSQKRTKNLPLNSCVFPRSSAKAGAESKHSAFIPSFANYLGAAIAGGFTVLVTLMSS
jgi:hypothetical protein